MEMNGGRRFRGVPEQLSKFANAGLGTEDGQQQRLYAVMEFENDWRLVKIDSQISLPCM